MKLRANACKGGGGVQPLSTHLNPMKANFYQKGIENIFILISRIGKSPIDIVIDIYKYFANNFNIID